MSTADIATLIATRTRLGAALAATDEDAWPGSRAYRARAAAVRALDEFDREHPDVLTEINRRHREKVLGGKDVRGL